MNSPTLNNAATQRELEALKNGASFGIMVIDALGQCSFLNQSGQEIFGIDCDESAKFGWLTRIHYDDQERVISEISALARTRDKKAVFARISHPSGRIRFCTMEFIPLFTSHGEVDKFIAIIQDISSYVHYQERYERFFTFSPQLLATANTSGYLTEVNPSWQKLLGYEEKELYSKPFLDFVHPADRERANFALQTLFCEQSIDIVEARLITRGKDFRSFLWNAVFSKEEDLFYIIALDVTENRLSERSLKLEYDLISSIKMHESLEESAEDIIRIICQAFEWSYGILWLLDKKEDRLVFAKSYSIQGTTQHKNFTRISEQFLLAKGECLPGKVWESGLFQAIASLKTETNFPRAPHALRCSFQSAFAQPIQAKNKFIGVLEFYSEKEFTYDRSLDNLFYALGNSLGEFSLRTKAEKKGYLLASIVETTSTAIFSQDRKGNVLSWNHGAEVLYGYSQEEMLGKKPDILLPQNSPTGWQDILKRVTEDKKVDNLETTRIKKGGQSFEVAISTSPIVDGAGRLIGFSTISYDISERKKLEKMKNEFISIVSHELRTPITSITGALKILLATQKNHLPQESYRLLEIADRNGVRLAKLVNDILDIGKMEAGKMIYTPTSCDLLTVLQNSIDNNRPFAKNHKVELELESSIKRAMVYADPDRLAQVITNFISNGVKFSRENGRVLLRISKDRGHIRAECIDKGLGIPKEMAGKLFQKFSQIDSSDNRKKEGTGLGLSICKMIIEKFGGTIGYESEEGKGSTFFFEIPEYTNKL